MKKQGRLRNNYSTNSQSKNKLTLVLVSAIVQNRKGEFLLLKRSSNNKSYQGHWQLPEGKIEFGEEPLNALKRELKEELDCRVASSRLIATSSVKAKIQGRECHLLRLAFKITPKDRKINLDSEHESFGWFRTEQLHKLPLVDGTREVLLAVTKQKWQ